MSCGAAARAAGGQSPAGTLQPGPADLSVSSLDRVRGMVQRDEFKDAEAALRAEVTADPGSADASFLLGYVLLRLNRPKESLDEFTRAAKLRKPSAQDLKHVADDYVLLGDFEDADRWMLRSVRMNEEDPEGWYGLGRIRYSEQRFQDALACFQKTLALAPRTVKGADNLGLAYEALNKRSEAIQAFRNALGWQKGSAHPSEQPMLNLATILVEQGQPDEAIPLLEEAVSIAPQDPKIHEQLGNAYAAKARLPEAEREFAVAVARLPDSAAYHYLLARVLHKEGKEAQSRAEFERSSALNGTHSTKETR